MTRRRYEVLGWMVLGCACSSETFVGSRRPPPVSNPDPVTVEKCTPIEDEMPVVVDVAAGGQTSCAVDSSGFVYCWGNNWSGEAARPASDMELESPLRSDTLACITDVVLNYAGCAHERSGRVWCWGDNALGDAGPAIDAGGGNAHPIVELENVVAVGLSAALLADGSVWAWGSQAYFSNRDPHRIEGIKAVALPTSGWGHCAIDEEGSVFCWGYNGAGEIGQLGSPGIFPPTLVELPEPAVEVVTGGLVCARLIDGSVWCWGLDPLGANFPETKVPERVPGIEDAVSVSVSRHHACIVEAGGWVWCWGSASSGELATPTTELELEPVLVEGLPPAMQVSCGSHHTCALTQEREVYCWGSNGYGQLGQGTHEGKSHVPRRVEIPLKSK